MMYKSYEKNRWVYINEKNDDEFTFDELYRTVELVSWSPDRIEFKTKTNSKQFLVISEIFYPEGWQVEKIQNNR